MAAVDEGPASTNASASRLADAAIAGERKSKVKGRPSSNIQEGDLIIMFMSRDKPPIPITVTPGQECTNAYGSFSHDSMVGLPFGAKVSNTTLLR
jgi:hypothetical protein